MRATRLRNDALNKGPTPRMPIAAASTTYVGFVRLKERIAPAKHVSDAVTTMAPQQAMNPERSMEKRVWAVWNSPISRKKDTIERDEAAMSRMPTITGILDLVPGVR